MKKFLAVCALFLPFSVAFAADNFCRCDSFVEGSVTNWALNRVRVTDQGTENVVNLKVTPYENQCEDAMKGHLACLGAIVNKDKFCRCAPYYVGSITNWSLQLLKMTDTETTVISTLQQTPYEEQCDEAMHKNLACYKTFF